MKIAGLQFDISWENPLVNFNRVREFAAEAKEMGTTFFVLPEMFATGFSMSEAAVSAHAEATQEFMGKLAKEMGMSVLGGYAEAANGTFYNACSIFDTSGSEVLHYRKIHPFTFAKEDEHYAPGDSLSTVVVDGVRVTPLICYDLRFPEVFRAAVDSTDLYCVIANWPTKRRDAWQTLLKARAIENQSYVLGINRVGQGSGLDHSGDSALVDPKGGIMDTETEIETLIMGEVKAARVAKTRERFSFVADRRPQIYQEIGPEI